MTLFEEIRKSGAVWDAHYSDLWFERTPATEAILDGYPLQKSNARVFISNIERVPWYDVPFAYDPYWEARQPKETD